jgi:hypothetical protein
MPNNTDAINMSSNIDSQPSSTHRYIPILQSYFLSALRNIFIRTSVLLYKYTYRSANRLSSLCLCLRTGIYKGFRWDNAFVIMRSVSRALHPRSGSMYIKYISGAYIHLRGHIRNQMHSIMIFSTSYFGIRNEFCMRFIGELQNKTIPFEFLVLTLKEPSQQTKARMHQITNQLLS